MKVKNTLIMTLCYLLFLGGMAAVVVFQYYADITTSTAVKISTPCMIALLVFFLASYKSIKMKINRKLTAVQTAKELGTVGQTNSIIANLLERLGVIVPIALMSGIFVIGGNTLVQTGYVLFEILGLYMIIVIGHIICDANIKTEIIKKEENKTNELVKKITDKINNLPKRYE